MKGLWRLERICKVIVKPEWGPETGFLLPSPPEETRFLLASLLRYK